MNIILDNSKVVTALEIHIGPVGTFDSCNEIKLFLPEEFLLLDDIVELGPVLLHGELDAVAQRGDHLSLHLRLLGNKT